MTKSQSNYSVTHFIQGWLVVGIICFIQIIYLFLSHGWQQELQQLIMPQGQREFLRSLFYLIAIINFPLTNGIRHIQRCSNQTLLSNKPLNKRYLTMIIISATSMASIGLLGFIMFIFGDDFNTLYIFSLLAFFGLFLHRPKKSEYQTLMAHQK